MNDLEETLFALEERLVHPEIRRDRETLGDLLEEEFREIGSSGRVFNKRTIVDLLCSEAPRDITLHDFRCDFVSPEIALVTYRSRSEAGDALRSSLWVCRDDCWRMLFHQGTQIAQRAEANAVS